MAVLLAGACAHARQAAAAARRWSCRRLGGPGAGRAGSSIARPDISRWRWSSSRGWARRRTASGWWRCAGATGRAPRSTFAPRSRSTRSWRKRTPTSPACCCTGATTTRRSIEARAALAIDPGYADARLIVGELLLRLGQLDDARWELEKLCAAAPERADARAASALVLARLGPHRGGRRRGARRAAPSIPMQPMAHRARAEILRRARRPRGRRRRAGGADRGQPGLDRRPARPRHDHGGPGIVGRGGARAGDAGQRGAAARRGPLRARLRRPAAGRLPAWRCRRRTRRWPCARAIRRRSSSAPRRSRGWAVASRRGKRWRPLEVDAVPELAAENGRERERRTHAGGAGARYLR